MTEDELQAFAPWLARRSSATQRLDPHPARALAATLDLPEPAAWTEGRALPPLWHPLYLHDLTPSAQLGPDGAPLQDAQAPATDSLMPPIPLPQLMWAGAEYRWHAPMVLGEVVRRHSRIAGMQLKTGRRGPMVFVSWEHQWSQHGGLALTAIDRAVFLGAEGGTPAAPAAEAPSWQRERRAPADEARLFRFSALTFNTHRIHYDLPYARDVAGYPALVVHGPLQALLIAEAWRAWHPDQPLERMQLRARAPLFLGRFDAGGVHVRAAAPGPDGTRAWTCGSDGQPCMEAMLQAASR
ncbi:MaoC family dehydratase N-terminal domain-containing protein [Xenophilus sp. Marseille-Q4582]|uniref:FAS1-like dehydratase domain-containing protein n=1 Tax=Xenophilus sp. Marseille-Q4582 TaxID=2866600 RepID=UPI001CE43148|nr:MaoC family dehydratase N-terminal domain-containing protein [Xenophilus sp. Marseille-Q4582]